MANGSTGEALSFDDIPRLDLNQHGASLQDLLSLGGEGLARGLHDALRAAAAPEKALIGLHRYVDACGDAAAMGTLLEENGRFLRTLTTVFSESQFLTDLLCRRPELGAWLRGQGDLRRSKSADEMLEELLGGEEAFPDMATCSHEMRLFRQREILRIAVREIVEYAPVVSTTQDLSNLADVTLEAALRTARQVLLPRYGTPVRGDVEPEDTPAGFVIIGMGKLGGQELNFSSDIDLLFIHAAEGRTHGGQSAISNAEYFQKLGELVIKALSEPSAEGIIFRVDMRLRPHGDSGPLSVSLEPAVEYYGEYGRAWERQAMIKARPCAGDLELGYEFLGRLRPFVYPKYFDDSTLEDIRDTKQQMEAKIAAAGTTDRQVKLGRGGIRDIEFTVQILQLLWGGTLETMRTQNTLKAVVGLGGAGIVRPFEADTLTRNYVFLRQVEHRLQIEGAQQRHTLPTEGPQLDEFARRLGYQDGTAFMNVYRSRTEETREVLDQFLASEGAGTLWVGDLLNPHSDGEAGLAELARMGFGDPEAARQELLLLCNGPKHRPHTLHVRQTFNEIAPNLLEALATAHGPDQLLIRLGQILAHLSAPGALYELLKHNERLCGYLVTLVANSDYLGRILIRDPGLLEILGTRDALDYAPTREMLDADLASLSRSVTPEAAPYSLRDGEMLRTAMRELTRHTTVAMVGDELTLLAEAVLGYAVWIAREKVANRYGPCDTGFAVLGLGKFGGWEMGYGSDMDLIFVYDGDAPPPQGMSATEYFSAVASHVLRSLKEPTRHGVLYDVDARLRPDGNKGPLAVKHHRITEYYTGEAEAWERLALMKGRAVAGDPEFMPRAEATLKEVAFSLPLTRDALERMEELRLRHLASGGPLDLKTSEGGISEAEFTVRLWQLEHVQEHPELMRGDVFGAMDIVEEYGLAPEEDCLRLRRAYRGLRRILNRVRMMDGSSETKLPSTPEDQALLAARLGIEGDLMEHVDGLRLNMHDLYLRTHAAAMKRVTGQ